ncbi:MAG: hypothetical protein HQL07_04530 [Nitrospirae bacterium]|nr:hypothetical protein [Magnetococcales bacterium]HAT50755.1 hypothetical protein [Alphaproteobacteria bacterium]
MTTLATEWTDFHTRNALPPVLFQTEEDETLRGMDNWIYSRMEHHVQSIHEHVDLMLDGIQRLSSLIQKEMEQGGSFDFEAMIKASEDLEREVGAQKARLEKSVRSKKKILFRNDPEKAYQLMTMFGDILKTNDRYIDGLRSARFGLMAMQAEAEDDGSGEVLTSEKDVVRFFARFK